MQASPPHPRTVLAEVFNITAGAIMPNCKIGDLPGWDSLSHVTLLIKLEEIYSVPVSRASFERCSSITGILALLEENGIKHLDE